MSRARGFTLVEVLVAVGVLSLISLLLYGSFVGVRRSKEAVSRLNDRHHEGRVALTRVVRELEAAYLSGHAPLDPSLRTTDTAFVLGSATRGSRLDFTSFAHRRLDRDAHESDQVDLSYFVTRDPSSRGTYDLVRRSKTLLDTRPGHGGRVEVLCTDVERFDVEVLDPLTGEWVESWDTTQATGQPGRLPLMARVRLVLRGGRRPDGSIELATSVHLPLRTALTFAIQ